MPQRLIKLGICVILLAMIHARAEVPSTAPTSQATSQNSGDPDIAAEIEALGDPNPLRRDQAATRLWSLGHRIEPQLQAAAGRDDPEVAARARSILEKLRFGLSPRSPAELFKLLKQYRSGAGLARQAALDGLVGRGPEGIRVAVALFETENDAASRSLIQTSLARAPHEAAVMLLADGHADSAERILLDSPHDADPATLRDWAALQVVQGTAAKTLADLQEQLHDAPNPLTGPQIAWLACATGDLATARKVADPNSTASLIERILIEQKDWKELARRASTRPDYVQTLPDLGYLAAYQRLSGDAAGLDRTVEAIVAYTDARQADPTVALFAPRVLFLNSRPVEAINLLRKYRSYLELSAYLEMQLRFSMLLQLPQQVGDGPSPALIGVRARAAVASRWIGDLQQAHQQLYFAASEARTRNDAGAWELLARAAQQLQDRAQSELYLAQAIACTSPAQEQQVVQLLTMHRVPDPELVSRWWSHFRQAQGGRRLPELAEWMLRFAAHHTPDELASLAGQIRQQADQIPVPGRFALLALAADTLEKADRLPEAAALYAHLFESQPQALFISRQAEIEAKQHHWQEAALHFQMAWDMDRTAANNLFMQGWCLRQAGNQSEASRLIELAHRLPLGNEVERKALMDVCSEHQCDADADRERQLILRTGDFTSWHHAEAERLEGDRAASLKQYARAADCWEQAFLNNLGGRWAFIDPSANLKMPALIAKNRALGFIADGDIPRALEQAKVCMTDDPSDADSLIEIANALRDSGHREQADAFFTSAVDPYRALIAEHPNSGPGHNMLAWAEACTGRQLDEAVAQARQAVELEPNNTASIDTLAETYFVRGQLPEAIVAMQKCIDLEPDQPHHRSQMKRFMDAQAKAGGR